MDKIQFRVNLFKFSSNVLVFTLWSYACCSTGWPQLLAYVMDDDKCDKTMKYSKCTEVDVLCLFFCLSETWEQKSVSQNFSLRQWHERINENKKNQQFWFSYHQLALIWRGNSIHFSHLWVIKRKF
jgi:hypothetical protein